MSGLIALSETITAIKGWRSRRKRSRGERSPDKRKLYLMYLAKLQAIKNQETLDQISEGIISEMEVSRG